MSSEQIKAIVFDHINFPELKKMTVPKWVKPDDVDQVRQIAIANNLDIELVRAESVTSTRFGPSKIIYLKSIIM